MKKQRAKMGWVVWCRKKMEQKIDEYEQNGN